MVVTLRLPNFFEGLIFELNRGRWDKRLSVVIPEGPEEIFYLVAFLRNKLPDIAGGPTLSTMLEDNDNILRVCETLRCKQYLPRYPDRVQWKRHFGSKWDLFVQNKQVFDPRAILSPGQNIFARRRVSLSLSNYSSPLRDTQE